MVVSPWQGANGGGSYKSIASSGSGGASVGSAAAVVGNVPGSVDSSDDESGTLAAMASHRWGVTMEKHSDACTLYSLPLSWPLAVNLRIVSHSPSCDTTRYRSLALCLDLSFFR